MKTKIVISALILAFVFTSFIGCTLEPVEIEEITVCKKVDSSAKPVEPTDTFPSGTRVVYVSARVNNMTPENKITTKWNYLETGEEINTADYTTEESGSGYVSFNLTIDQGFPQGEYNIEVYLNDELSETVEFSVE